MNIIFGIIIDTFAELRDEKNHKGKTILLLYYKFYLLVKYIEREFTIFIY